MTEPDNERPTVGAADCGVAGGDDDTAMVGLAGQAQALRVPCLVYSRIVGYMRPLEEWNQAKQQEFADRKPFDISGPKYNLAGQ